MSHVCSCIAVSASNQFFVCLYCCVGIQPVCFVCIAVLASNQFFLFVLLGWHPTSFFVCIAVLASNNSTAAFSGGTWCSEEGATITIRLRVTCKQLSVLATLVIVFEKLFYHFQFENSELNVCLHYFSDWLCLVDSILQWWYPPWCSDWH